MPYLSLIARGLAVVEARPDNNSIVLKIGDGLISLDPAEAFQIGADLIATAGRADPDGIAGGVTASADSKLETVAITIAGQRVLDLDPAAWATLVMQGSNAALELQSMSLRTGLRRAVLHRGKADLVGVPA